MSYLKINLEHICDWIRAERIKQGYSQRDFAKKTGLARSTITHLELNKNPKLSTIVKCCFSLGYRFNIDLGNQVCFTLTSLDMEEVHSDNH